MIRAHIKFAELRKEIAVAYCIILMFDLPDSPPGLFSMDPLAQGTYTLGSNENVSQALRRGLSARFSRHPFFSSTRSSRTSRDKVISRQASTADMNKNNEQMGVNGKTGNSKGVERFFNKFIKQISVLTLNHANQRKRHKTNDEAAEDDEQQADMPQSVSHSNLDGTNKTASAASRKCSTLPARFDYTPGVIGLRNHGNTCFINGDHLPTINSISFSLFNFVVEIRFKKIQLIPSCFSTFSHPAVPKSHGHVGGVFCDGPI